jgi:hypothetical protein
VTYDEFIQSKVKRVQACGFEPPLPIHKKAFGFQVPIIEWAVSRGRAALFADCGLGKTFMQLEWARQIHAQTRQPVFIACPLAVADQTVQEGAAFGIEVKHCRQAVDFTGGINITNFDRVELFDKWIPECAGVVLDESSILKSFTGTTRRMLTDLFRQTPYKLCCTATPAPNDFTELGQHADFLGICTPAEMLATYFINDTFDTGTWRLKGHAVEAFWKWVASWAVCISKPSDLGFSDAGYELPPLETHVVKIKIDHRADLGSGELFRNPHVSATELHAENRRSLTERCEEAARIVNGTHEAFVVWCATNDESELLAGLIPDAVEIRGADTVDKKEMGFNAFRNGLRRVIITKAKMGGMGSNWQHCRNDLYVGTDHSWEKFYQCGKRIHRFGQKRECHRYIITTDLDNGVLATLDRKQEQFETMKELVRFSREALTKTEVFTTMNTEIRTVTAESGKWTMHHGDCVRVAKTLADDSVGFSVFSPPFADLFTYSNDVQDMGNCPGLNEFMTQFGYLITELGRVTMPGRHVAVHCCDLLSTKWKDGDIGFKNFSDRIAAAFCGNPDDVIDRISDALNRKVSEAFKDAGWVLHSRVTIWKDPVTEMQRTKAHGLLYKTLKQDSSKSRVGAPDYLLVFRKKGENPKPIPHNPDNLPLDLWQQLASPVWMNIDQGRVLNGKLAREQADERHICPLQLGVIENALTLWSAVDDLVFSPFGGIGSEGYCAVKMGRRFVGAELKASYHATACDHLKQAEEQQVDLFNRAVEEPKPGDHDAHIQCQYNPNSKREPLKMNSKPATLGSYAETAD